MTGDVSVFAISTKTKPLRAMSFPYHSTEAWLGFGCTSDSEWIFLGFSSTPNLNRTELLDGFNRIKTRARFNESVVDVVLTQRWGSSFLHFSEPKRITPRIIQSNTFLIELNWHRQDNVHFEINLTGSAAAIEQARTQCGSIAK
ncbi:hypothetical protein CWE06_10770 [Aliidiomarina haloalkalitolerans]|uniref:Uncharacterized protein n=2 Tax=Aliidiomarina haloalkalitolerans TaxID=859059 RepID=A0A432VR22_9GAMM|nr:hypothetical protein CWE06_10770 [Aliidiomarina haloalkalitolerans]